MTRIQAVVEDFLGDGALSIEQAADRHYSPHFRQRTNGQWADRPDVLKNLQTSVTRPGVPAPARATFERAATAGFVVFGLFSAALPSALGELFAIYNRAADSSPTKARRSDAGRSPRRSSAFSTWGSHCPW